ncbi:hypothetical protein [Acutalibacter sp.]|uniref:hypothetical protein n=1 Tax=Acutalibacter sp. TaxID=1918636 RepID=UPI00216E8F05|nr:hypothetical protein [Acutalibacter sp.]
MEELGGADPAVLPKILQTWGDTPASYFFPKAEQWERMQRIPGLAPAYGEVITYRQMAWAIQELCEAPFHVNGSGTFTDAAMLLGSAFPDCRPTSVPHTASSQRLPLSERLKGPDIQLKQAILDLRTQALARAIDGMTGDKPMDYSRFVQENIDCHFAPEDEGKIPIRRALYLAGGWDDGKAACVYHYLLALPFTMI